MSSYQRAYEVRKWSLLGWLATGLPLLPESAPGAPRCQAGTSFCRGCGWVGLSSGPGVLPLAPGGIFGGMQKLRADKKSVLTRVYEHLSDASISAKKMRTPESFAFRGFFFSWRTGARLRWLQTVRKSCVSLHSGAWRSLWAIHAADVPFIFPGLTVLGCKPRFARSLTPAWVGLINSASRRDRGDKA